MHSLLTLLTQFSVKAWIAVIVAVFSCGAATVFYFSSANAAPSSAVGTPTVAVQAGHAGDLSSAVPDETNTGLLLAPVGAAMLWFCSRRLWPAKPSLAADGQNVKGAFEP
jgi:hypothetical protein